MADYTFDNARVEIVKSRWQVRIGIKPEGQPWTVLIASADSFHTLGDGIWFGTYDELKEVDDG